MMGKRLLAAAAVTVMCLFVLVCVAQAQEQVVDKNGRVLTKVTFIHYRKAPGKPAGGGGGGGKTASGYYTYIANGARWKVAEPVYLNPANGGVPADCVTQAATAAMFAWDGPVTFGIFGTLYPNSVTGPDGQPIAYNNGAKRGYNTISFGVYQGGNANVIAVTTVWGDFGGPTNRRDIYEAHILLNTGSTWAWGDGALHSSLMDVQNILTHELGHWVGMGDLYQTGAVLETMYGYSSEGETIKRDLYKGDLTGVTKLYPQ